MTPTQASQAYSAAQGLLKNVDLGTSAEEALKPHQFGELLKSTLEGISDSGQKTETMVTDLASGKSNIVDLVTAVAETEAAIETLVTVRDRMTTAYKEILNMPI